MGEVFIICSRNGGPFSVTVIVWKFIKQCAWREVGVGGGFEYFSLGVALKKVLVLGGAQRGGYQYIASKRQDIEKLPQYTPTIITCTFLCSKALAKAGTGRAPSWRSTAPAGPAIQPPLWPGSSMANLPNTGWLQNICHRYLNRMTLMCCVQPFVFAAAQVYAKQFLYLMFLWKCS